MPIVGTAGSLVEFSTLDPVALLQLQAGAVTELKRRKIVRTHNNPLGDYSEWLVAKRLKLILATNSAAGYDAESEQGVKFQIKGRRVTSSNSSRQLSAIRNYAAKDFDYLVAVIFNEQFAVESAYLVPHEIVGKYAKYREHVNAHILVMAGPITTAPGVMEIADQLVG